MAKKKRTISEKLEDLAELAGSLNIPDDALDVHLRDAADIGADLAYDAITKAVMLDKLQFLHDHGYSLVTIKGFIKEGGR